MTTENRVVVPTDDIAFQVEQRGIDFVPPSDRWATPRNIGAMWAGSSLNVEYFIYGALLMGFGFSFWSAVVLIVVGNVSFFLLGIASLQGPEAGTTAFTISRAPFGTRGAKLISFFNWLTQLGFETEGLILIVGAAVVLTQMAGVHANSTVRVLFVLRATAIQAVLPYFGHATMVKVLRSLIIPFALIFLAFAVFAANHFHAVAAAPFASGWQLWTAGLAFTIALSGLGWTECGNDYTRYLPRDVAKRQVVGWIFLGTAVPEIVLMVIGAMSFTFLSGSTAWSQDGATVAWNGSNPFEAFQHGPLPSWFLALFLIIAIVQLFGINSLDLYSSGVSLQAMGLNLRRYQAVLLDSAIAGSLTLYATFQSTFSLYMKEFVGVIIVWIAPWFGIFIVDWILRKFKYSAQELQRSDRGGIYFAQGGVNWNAMVAFGIGLVLALSAFSKAPPPVSFPFHWMTPVSNHFGGTCAADLVHGTCQAGWYGGADFSIFFGIFGAGVLYAVLELFTKTVQRQTERQRALEPQS